MNQTSTPYRSRRALLAYCSLLMGAALSRPALGVEKKAVILILGDSLSAGYGLPLEAGWVSQLKPRLAATRFEVVNASLSGETSAGGLSRLPALLQKHQPTITVVELGTNDGLRGLPLTALQKNLTQLIALAQTTGSKVMLVPVGIPSNYGQKYADDFEAVFTNVARLTKAALSPSLLKGLGDAPDSRRFFQADQLHPTAAAQPTMLGNVWPTLKTLIEAPHP